MGSCKLDQFRGQAGQLIKEGLDWDWGGSGGSRIF